MLPGSVRLDREGHYAHLIIDRPSKLNSMTVDMDRQMNELVYEINNDADIRCVVLRGEGTRAFSAGSDINDLGEYGTNWEYRNRFDRRRDYVRAVWQIRKPVIAAVNGYAYGGGLEMACASDIRIAGTGAAFSAGEIRWGWHAGSGQTQFLTRLIGAGHAAKLLMTGLPMGAEEAHAVGLVQELLEPEDVVPRAVELAELIASLSPIAIERTKFMIRSAENLPMEAALLVENDSFAYIMMTEDAEEGRRAFAEKRTPQFRGR
ncbi:enoyl-CoA hydratase/isomerase family protein [Microbacterium sp. SLBN-154]|uniref:enoyl-CoA hydratase/isomerase family protein n=1 Tax=Microbacterium sp. SLBN-154 TaxID=2768458 RepID=UPI00190F28E9|nr:enoyl-CoA hydratase-related protein [Microbacterium sp. SLBN-154]